MRNEILERERHTTWVAELVERAGSAERLTGAQGGARV